MPITKKPQPKFGVSDKLTFTQPRATLDELLEFANRVRAAGGGNPLDALMPSVPSDSHQCLIAKNLNFNCTVDGMRSPDGGDDTVWFIYVQNDDTRDRIAESLGLRVVKNDEYEDVILLPPEIGQVAADFDSWNDAIVGDGRPAALDEEDPAMLERLKTFWPYIAESEREAYDNATFVNEKGELIL